MKLVKWFGTLAMASVLSVSAFISTSEASVYTSYDRISGSDRYETAIQVSKAGWANGSTNHVILAIGNNYPDALAGAPLSKKLNAPILLTKKDAVPAEILAEIKRVGAKNVTVLGGAGTISDAVLKQLTSAGITPARLAGSNRHETSAKIAEQVGGTSAVIASGSNFADSLAIASYAAEKGMPILLTTPGKMFPEVEAIAKNYDKITVVGGELAVNQAVITKLEGHGVEVERVSGKSRYGTAAAIVSEFYPSTVTSSLVASGQNFADALTGSALGAKKQKPVLLVKQASLPSATKSVISEKNVTELTVIGGEIAVSKDALNPNPPPPPPPPAPKPEPKPEPKPAPVVDVRKLIVEEAYKVTGVPYRYGGTTTSGFDCSGFIQYVFKKEGITLPRTTGQMAGAGKAVSYANAKPGDVIILDLNNSRPTRASHAGIYLGNGQIIHAGVSKGVSVMSLHASWANWDDKIVSVRSFVN